MNRRDFLGWAATGVSGLLLPTLVRPKVKVFDMGRGLIRPPVPQYLRPVVVSRGNDLTFDVRWEYGFRGQDGGIAWISAGLAERIGEVHPFVALLRAQPVGAGAGVLPALDLATLRLQ